MKRVLSIFLAVVMLMSMFNTAVFAADFEYSEGDWTFTYSDTQKIAVVTGYTGSDAALTIPSVIDVLGVEYPVTKVGASALQNNTTVTSVVIPNTIEYLNDYAFDGCTNLTTVTFEENSSLLRLGSTVNGGYVFRNCSSLTDIVLPDSVEAMYKNIFEGCTSLTTIAIPDSVAAVGTYMFKGCTSLENVTLGSGISGLSKFMFQNCTGLKEIRIPGNITSMSVASTSLTFAGCTSLATVIFEGETAPTLSTTTTSSTKVTARPFGYATTVYYPASGTGYDITGANWPYNFADGAQFIPVEDGEIPTPTPTPTTDPNATATPEPTATPEATEAPLWVVDAETGTLITYNGEVDDDLVIPSEINGVQIKIIGNGSESITASPISGAVVIPEGVTQISGYAFSNTQSAITSVTLPETLETISQRAFAYSDIQQLNIPASVTFIGSKAFIYSSSLALVTFECPVAPELSTTPFQSLTSTAVVYYPKGATGYDDTWKANFPSTTTFMEMDLGEMPTPAPTATPDPNATATPEPTATPVPTATPEATSTPSPTPEPEMATNIGLYINEVCPGNDSVIADKNGNYEDYIEIFNGSDGYVNLKGYAITDSAKQPMQYVFPDVLIPEGGYLIVFTAKDSTPAEGEVYANFGISKTGETIYLTNPSGEFIDYMTLPTILDDQAYGRIPDGTTTLRVFTPSPGETNNNATVINSFVQPPVFSVESGFYANEFNLNIYADEGLTVYYTTDGSIPSPENTEAVTYTTDLDQGDVVIEGATNQYTIQASKKYEGEDILVKSRLNDENVHSNITLGLNKYTKYMKPPTVKVDKCTVIRAVAYDAEGFASECVSKTYFVGPEYSNLQEKYAGAVIISLVTDPHNIYNYETGIQTLGKNYYEDGGSGNYMQKGREWEREAHMDFFEGDGSLAFSQEVGIRLRGRGARSYLQRGLSIYARSEYGEKYFNYKLFPDEPTLSTNEAPIEQFKSFMLRNGGDTDTDLVKFHDPLNQNLLGDSDTIGTQDFRPAVVFLDGEYFGPYCLMERFSEEYVESHWGVPADNVVLSDEEDSDKAQYVKNPALYLRYHDVTDPEVYETVKNEYVDIDSAIDYSFIQTYIQNHDWVSTNFRYWNSIGTGAGEYFDGKVRYLLYDTDRTCTDPTYDNLGGSNGETTNYIAGNTTFGWVKATQSNRYYGLLANEDYRQRWVSRVSDLININYDPEKVVKQIEEHDAVYSVLMPTYYSRFSSTVGMGSYNNAVQSDKDFYTQRPYYYRLYIQRAFEFEDIKDVTVNADTDMGSVKLTHAVEKEIPFEENTWTGKYFSEYPMTLTAVPKENMVFTGWTVEGDATLDDPTAETVNVTFTGNYTLTANFESTLVDREGSGTDEDPYLIGSVEDLVWMAGVVKAYPDEYGTKVYALKNDIVFEETDPFEPIGTESCPFAGTFDGQYYTISGINAAPSIQGSGLFGWTSSTAVVKNVGVINSSFLSSSKNVGLIVGNNAGLITTCYSSGTASGVSTVGGITGNNRGGKVENCYSIAEIISGSANTLSGIAGKTEAGGTVTNCYSLINPVQKNDGGVVDSLTRIVTATELADGTVTALLNGETGTAWEQDTDYPRFALTKPTDIALTSISFAESTVELTTESEDYQLVLNYRPSNATDKTTSWSSSDENVVTVSQTGLVSVVGVGTAQITATASGKTAVCTVVVKAPIVTERFALLEDTYADGGNKDQIRGAGKYLYTKAGEARNIYIKGDISGAEGREIESVTLNLYMFVDTTSDATINVTARDGGTLPVYGVASNDWDEDVLNWNTGVPDAGVTDTNVSIGNLVVDSEANNGFDRYYSVDVTDFALASEDGIFTLKITGDSSNTSAYKFKSKECGDDSMVPYIEVKYRSAGVEETKLTMVKGDNSVVITAPEGTTAKLLLAEYREDGTLNAVKFVDVTASGEYKVPETMTGTVQAILVNDVTNIQPLLPSVNIK